MEIKYHQGKSMDFIYRIPLIDFDPQNEKEIQTNWSLILEKIHLSSPSFHHELLAGSFESLDPSSHLKLYKYLVRGRYRSTPFGAWSAVGIGKWSDTTQTELSLECSPIPFQPFGSMPVQKDFGVTPGLKDFPNHLQFWSFDPEDQVWVYSVVEKNKLINLLTDYLKKKKSVHLGIFSRWFIAVGNEKIQIVWNQLIKTGIIQNLGPFKKKLPKSSTNLKTHQSISLSHTIRDQLEDFLANCGSFFQPYKRPFLDKFISLYQSQYDDRFCSLDFLLQDYCLLMKIFENPSLEPTLKKQINFFKEISTLDLNQTESQASLPLEISDIQILFQIGEDDQIIINNLVINRPYVYSGRFTDDPELYQFSKSKNVESHKIDQFIYCDILIHESDTINFLCRHQNVHSYHTSPFPSIEPNHIDLSELYIGLDQTKIILIWRKKNIRVIPVFQHPLNGNQITHPLFRLLWELSNQDSFKFLPYLDPNFQSSSYTPRLKWKNMVLQEKQWIISQTSFSKPEECRKFIEENQLPHPLRIGYMDQELILHWKEPKDLQILWKELQHKKQLHLSECLSLGKSPFYSSQGNPVYPQFVYQKKLPHPKLGQPEFINYLDDRNDQTLYYKISAAPHTLLWILQTVLPELIGKIKAVLPSIRWYFLFYYQSCHQIRIRFLNLNPHEKGQVVGIVYQKLTSVLSGNEVEIAPYFPEYEKYGKKSISLSESMFQIESELLLFGTQKQCSPLVDQDPFYKAQLVSEIWCNLFLSSGYCQLHHNELKKLLKGIPFQEVKILRAKFDSFKRAICLPPEVISYGKLLKRHEFQSIYSKQKILYFNHFHMMVNRFFMFDSQDFEKACRYLVYRKLGRKLFGDQDSTKA